MRKLASIQRVWDLVPIDGADRIELAKVMGWQCVVNKGTLNIGDKVVYFEVDSFLPLSDERWEFLKKSSYKKNEIMGEGLRIRTQKFRGQISQGLALPLTLFPELKGYDINDDVSEVLGIRKWEMPEISGDAGTAIGPKPYGIPTTDETRVQSDDDLRQQLIGKPYYITTKMDGTSCTMYSIDRKFGVCGRNYEYKDDGKCSMWTYAHKHNIPNKLTSRRKEIGDIVLQGEFCGPKIQGNRLQLKEPEWYVFNCFLRGKNGNYELQTYQKMQHICDTINVKCVPLEKQGENFNYSLDKLLEKAKGKYKSGQHKEGIVVRPLNPEYCETLGKALSFKVLNNDFLLKDV